MAADSTGVEAACPRTTGRASDCFRRVMQYGYPCRVAGLPDKAKKVSDSTHAKFKRGEGVAVSKVANKALRGRLRHAEHTQNTAVKDAKKVYEWLQPTSGGYLEAEGLERTRQFKQQDIVQARQPCF